MGRTAAMLATLALVLGLFLPAAGHARASRPPTGPAQRGVLFVVGGVGGLDTLPISAQVFLPMAGVGHEIRNFAWTHGMGRVLRDLQDTEHVVRKAAELAEQVRRQKEREPDRPVYLIAKSGGAGVALLCAGQLPPDTLERVLLLSAAVSPAYDLRPALRATRGGIVSFYSPNDQLILHWGTATFGTIDRHYGPGAGLVGFTVPSGLGPEDRQLYERLVQVSWKPHMLRQGYAGTHSGTSAPAFLAAEVAPWLR